MSGRPVAEPKLILLALGAVGILVLCIGDPPAEVDERAYQRALHAETSTVASLRRAGVNAAGHVGDRDPAHAIEDALALFPAGTVVVVARGHEADAYREHVDFDALRRRIGADVYVREFVDR